MFMANKGVGLALILEQFPRLQSKLSLTVSNVFTEVLTLKTPENIPSHLSPDFPVTIFTDFLVFKQPYWKTTEKIKALYPLAKVLLSTVVPYEEFSSVPGYVPPTVLLPFSISELELKSLLFDFSKMRGSSEIKTADFPINYPPGLTSREKFIFILFGHGMKPREIASILGLSVRTVDTHRENIKHKFSFSSSMEIVRASCLWLANLENFSSSPLRADAEPSITSS
jgi:DNA-binding CsgD family transcriptional regulator